MRDFMQKQRYIVRTNVDGRRQFMRPKRDIKLEALDWKEALA